MYVSRETPEQTHARLTMVLADAHWVVYSEPYAFVEFDVAAFTSHWVPQALAFVRDENVWSALVPSYAAEQERFVLFSFHFPPGLDNSGFVGWLASHLKMTLGTGVMVVCGHNSNRGGIFDHWGAPVSVADAVLSEIERLRNGKNFKIQRKQAATS